MEMPTDPLALSIWLFKHVRSRGIQRRTVTGILPQEVDFHDITQRLESYELLGADEDEETRTIEFHLPHVNDGFFALNFDELLNAPARRNQVPTRFYIADIDLLYPSDDEEVENPKVSSYLSIVDLITTLKSVSDYNHQDNSGNLHLIFIGSEKVDIDTCYGHEDLISVPSVQRFKEFFAESDTHRSQKQTIIRSSLVELFGSKSNCGGNLPLPILLKRFRNFFEKIEHNYDLYISEFSFEKVRSQVEKEKTEFVARLNRVFSDIQNQLLAVPAALILAGSQMKNTQAWAEGNLLIWMGCLVFGLFMTMLIRNQRLTLLAVNQEREYQWKKIDQQYHDIADRFREIYQQIHDRYKHQLWLLRTVDLLVALVIAATTIMLLWFSGPIKILIDFLGVAWKVALPLFLIYLAIESGLFSLKRKCKRDSDLD